MTELDTSPNRTPLFAQFAQTSQPLGKGKPSRPLKPTEPSKQLTKPTDDELGEQLLARWNGKYVYMYGAWHRYESGLWRRDDRAAIEFWNILIANKKNQIRPNAGKATSVERYCQLRALVDDTALDVGHAYVNLQNGLYSLREEALEPHNPNLYFTSQLPFAYDPNATCPMWHSFLDTVLVSEDGQADFDLKMLVMEAFGYSLTADTSFRTSFWCVGPSGTGKSTLINTLTMLAGDSHVAIDLDSLKDNQYQLADVAGKRLVTFSEPDSRQPLADGWYKRLVSKDPISARSPYGKPFHFVPMCKVWGSMNATPRVIDRSDAVYGRVIIIPMNKVIPHNQRDLQLEDKLRAELPGIFNWALQGLENLRVQGAFTQSAQSNTARDEYRAENDAEALYVSECCNTGESYQATNEHLYQDYKAWCLNNGYSPKHKASVGRDWKRLGFKQLRTTGGKRLWLGVCPNTVLPGEVSA